MALRALCQPCVGARSQGSRAVHVTVLVGRRRVHHARDMPGAGEKKLHRTAQQLRSACRCSSTARCDPRRSRRSRPAALILRHIDGLAGQRDAARLGQQVLDVHVAQIGTCASSPACAWSRSSSTAGRTETGPCPTGKLFTTNDQIRSLARSRLKRVGHLGALEIAALAPSSSPASASAVSSVNTPSSPGSAKSIMVGEEGGALDALLSFGRQSRRAGR